MCSQGKETLDYVIIQAPSSSKTFNSVEIFLDCMPSKLTTTIKRLFSPQRKIKSMDKSFFF